MSKSTQVSLEELSAFAKRRAFVFPTSEIYGGLLSSYDYGPNGVELLRKIKNLWWDFFISRRDDMLGLDSQILLHPQTWVASGHVGSFTDPLVEDKVNHKRYRADHLIEAWLEKHPETRARFAEDVDIASMKTADFNRFIQENALKSPDGNPLTEAKDFTLLFETAIGAVAGEKSTVYLRGETAQGIFSDFKQVLDSTRAKLPFGLGQIGKSFRNEITTGQFVFRTLEFEQAEIEYFFDPEKSDWQALFKDWQENMWYFVTKILGIKEEKLRWRRHSDAERSHYSKDTYDLEYQFPFGWKEIWGIAYRTDYDLKQHMKFSGKSLEYLDPVDNRKFVPHVIEPAVGIARLFLMVLFDSYHHDESKDRNVLSLPARLAPYQVAIFPLVKNKPELLAAAQQLYQGLKQKYRSAWDDRGNIGKRYLSQDEVGTPFCITVDYQTLEDQTVTLRERDSSEQKRVAIAELDQVLASLLS